MDEVSGVPQRRRSMWVNTGRVSAERGLFLFAIDPCGLVLSRAR